MKTVEVSDETYKHVLRYVLDFGESFDSVVARLCRVMDNMAHSASVSQGHGAVDVVAAMEFANDAAERARQRLVGRVPSPYELEVKGLVNGDTHFRTSRNIFLPVGAPLKGVFRGFMVDAAITARGIEYAGEVYDNPSKAAVAAKLHHGAPDEKSAQSNGWTFWQIEFPPGSGEWHPLNVIRALQTSVRQDDGE